MSDSTGRDGVERAADERCMWCGTCHADMPVGRFPIPDAPDQTAPICVECWADSASDATALSEEAALVIGTDELGFGSEAIGAIVGRSPTAARDIRKTAVTETAAADTATWNLLTAIGVQPPRPPDTDPNEQL